jgi:hypothetical protein
MRSFLLVILSFVCCSVAFAQSVPYRLLLGSDSLYRSRSVFLEVFGSVDARSNAINTHMMDRFLLGGKIQDRYIDKAIGELQNANRAGFSSRLGISYYNFADTLLGSPHWGLYLNAEDVSIGMAAFSEDLFRVVFRGNSGYKGSRAIFDQGRAEYLRYQQMGIGIFHKKTLSGISIGYVNGQDYFLSKLDKASLYTSSAGDSLALAYQANIWQSDTSSRVFLSGSGAGAALAMQWRLPFAGGGGYLMMDVRDLGFIHFSDQTVNYRADSVFTYTGIDISDVFDSDNVFKAPVPQDSLSYSSAKLSHTIWLPAKIRLALLRELGLRDFYEIAVTAITREEFVPEIMLSYFFLPSDRWVLGASARYGGFGAFRAGLQAEYVSGTGFYLRCGIEDLAGMFQPEAKGRGLQLAISKFF